MNESTEKWKCFKPEESNGWWRVETETDIEICTCYTSRAGEYANQIVKDHNLIIKQSKTQSK